ncbi:hypothetical protein OS493_017943 [Desmophyllum pertusum]|uniref:Uncharacterized protein n=1 Tax=Desmophyllum pertusum TaxID=174260 RepID=A0A9X0CRD9_9CNID|nr:hypothetical protein OS493_017943 [Desmophyllum pertusum]
MTRGLSRNGWITMLKRVAQLKQKRLEVKRRMSKSLTLTSQDLLQKPKTRAKVAATLKRAKFWLRRQSRRRIECAEKTETTVECKEAASRTTEDTKHDLASVASAELKESEKEIHSSDSSLKTDDYENNTKQSSDKIRATLDNTTESSDQGDDSEATSDVETSKHEKGARAGAKGSSRTSEKDLRKRSLNLSLSNSFRSTRTEGESPTRDVLSTSQDEDSESYSDNFDESPLVENKAFQPRFGRRRRSELDRLQVDMKYSGPLWQWSGRSFQHKRKGKGKKSFYKAIVRGDETICVSDSAFPVPELVSCAIISFPVLRLLSSLMIGS